MPDTFLPSVPSAPPAPPAGEGSPLPRDAAQTSAAQKALTTTLWMVLALVFVGVVVGKLVPRHAQMPVLFAAPRFALTDQDARPFSAADLRGKPYICDFIFTTCGSSCPLMTQKMAKLQRETPAGVGLVSFTVNPERDTPAALKAYAARYNADGQRWKFLTGTPDQMRQTIRDMNIGVQPANGQDPILHSQKFLLVDGDGNVRGDYNSEDPQAMQKLAADAKWIAKTRGARG